MLAREVNKRSSGMTTQNFGRAEFDLFSDLLVPKGDCPEGQNGPWTAGWSLRTLSVHRNNPF